MEKAFLLLGPSGSGKSTYAPQFASVKDFLHYEADRDDGLDGIDFHGIREQWNLFHDQRIPGPLAEIMIHRARSEGKNGTVLSLPSMIFPPELLIQARQVGLNSIILYGTVEECLTSFREREQTGRKLTDEHWLTHNSYSYVGMGLPELASFRVQVFDNGIRRNSSQIIENIAKMINQE